MGQFGRRDDGERASHVEQATLRIFACPRGHHAVIYDLLAFCPWCGTHTPPRAVFGNPLAAQRELMRVVAEQPAEAKADIEAKGGATALAERALTAAVAASQSLARQLHAQADKEAPKGNPWQNVDRLARQWRTSFRRRFTGQPGRCDGEYPASGLCAPPRGRAQRRGRRRGLRHVGQTDQGVVGRRIRIRPTFVEEAFAAVEKLADRLEEAAQATA